MKIFYKPMSALDCAQLYFKNFKVQLSTRRRISIYNQKEKWSKDRYQTKNKIKQKNLLLCYNLFYNESVFFIKNKKALCYNRFCVITCFCNYLNNYLIVLCYTAICMEMIFFLCYNPTGLCYKLLPVFFKVIYI